MIVRTLAAAPWPRCCRRLALASAAQAQQAYPTPEAAADALVDGIARHDDDAIKTVLGPDYRQYIPAATRRSGRRHRTSSRPGRAAHTIVPAGRRQGAMLGAGSNGWTMPIPIVKTAAGWQFDTGRRRRRCASAASAATSSRRSRWRWPTRMRRTSTTRANSNGDGRQAVRDAAALSSPGKRDGLYWASLPGEPESPLGAGIRRRQARSALPRLPSTGSLTAQGKDAPGGAKSYVKNGRMTEGYALIAWPAKYGDTGVMTFIVNQDGVVYEKNLGPNTAALARGDDRVQSGRELGEGRTAETVASPGSGAPPAVTGRRPPRAAYLVGVPPRRRTARPTRRGPPGPARLRAQAGADSFRPRHPRLPMNVTTPPSPATQKDPAASVDFSPIDDELPLRWQRALHLAPEDGLGVGRRAVFFALLTWLPIAVWAFLRGRFIDVAVGEPLLQHYGVHVRCLVAIPLLILGEASLHGAALRLLPQFLRKRPGRRGQRGRVSRRRLARLAAGADATLPWVFVLGAALGWTLVEQPDPHDDALTWALMEGGGLGFGGCGSRTSCARSSSRCCWAGSGVCVAGRAVRATGTPRARPRADAPGSCRGAGLHREAAGRVRPGHLRAVGDARLALGARHPSPRADARRAEVAGGGLRRRLDAAVAAAAAGADAGAARDEEGGVARLFGTGGHAGPPRAPAVGRPDVDAEPPEIEPAGVGPIADAAAMYDAARSMRSAPIGKASLAGILGPILVPMLVVAALQIPLKSLVLKILKALI